MCNNALSPYLVGMSASEHRAIVFQADCDLWTCDECAERKKSKWVARAIVGSKTLILNGSELWFVTITSHRTLGNFAATVAVFPHAWSLMYSRMKRKQATFDYLMILELHKNGRLHSHMLTSLSAKTRWWKDSFAYSGLGYQTKIRAVENEGSAAGYVSKYIGKSLVGIELPTRLRRIRVSQGWAKLPELHESSGNYEWWTCNSPEALLNACTECQRRHLTMVDMRSGEVFDYPDITSEWVTRM